MAAFAERYGPWALVTGASSGIGAAFARAIAARGLDVVLVARRHDVLVRLAAELRERHGVDARPVACDLADAGFLDVLGPAVAGLDVGLLVNNAGFCNTGLLIENPLAAELALVDVNCRAPLVLAHEFGGAMRARGRGGIVFVASTVGLSPTPTWANYAASKAYDLFLGEAMYEEMRPFGVDVLAVCPGATRTGFQEVARLDIDRAPLSQLMVRDPGAVAERALARLGRTPSTIVGWDNALTAFLLRLAPRRLVAKAMGVFIRRVTAA
jgi:short-subunit dehydrogenase